MERVNLYKVNHDTKIGKPCPAHPPNITEDSKFYEGDEVVGFYIKRMPEDMCKLADLANHEFNSKNVPKTYLDRSDVLQHQQANPGMTRSQAREKGTSQMSVILGAVPPKPQFMRHYGTISKVHQVPSARNYIKAMLLLAQKSEELIKKIMPEQYEKQSALFNEIDDKWKFANLFTSSIANYNISAPFHRDTGNIVGAVNVIITKRHNCKGGNLHVPDYNATMDSANNSILVYPAWRNVHGVTPIEPTYPGGYRNSLIFYPLKAFQKL